MTIFPRIKILQTTTVMLFCLWALSVANPVSAATCANPCVMRYQLPQYPANPASTVNIVFVSQGFSAGDIANYYSITGIGMLSTQLEWAPFNLYANYFNVYIVTQYGGLDEGLTAEAIAALPNIDHIIYVKNQNGRAYAWFFGDIVVFLDSGDATLNHELGHALAGLHDEYVDTDYCPSGVYTGGEPSQVNVTINSNPATVKWKQWWGVQGVGLVAGGIYCSSGIYHPVFSLMTSHYYTNYGTTYGPYGPVNVEEIIYQIDKAVNPIASQTPASPSQVGLLDTQQTLQLSAQLDPLLKPQNVSPNVQWYRYDDAYNLSTPYPIPGAMSTTYTVDLNTIPASKTIAVRMVVMDPDATGYYNRRGTPFLLGNLDLSPRIAYNVATPLSGLWIVSRGAATVPPTITSVPSTTVSIGSLVTINGTNFCFSQCFVSNGTETWVSVGGGPFTPTTGQITPTTLSFTVPSGSWPGTVAVQLRNPSTGQVLVQGTSTQVLNLAILAPSISSHNPLGGLPGTSVALTGNNFCNGPCSTGSVRIIAVAKSGGNTSFTVMPSAVTSTSIVFQVPIIVTAGEVWLSVQLLAPNGLVVAQSNASTFIVALYPTITSVFPTSGNPGDSVVIQGTNLCGGGIPPSCHMTLTINGEYNNLISSITDTQLTFQVPAGVSTGPLTVTTPGGTASGGTFIIPNPVIATVTLVSPTSAQVGASVLVYGNNFCYQQSCSALTVTINNGMVIFPTYKSGTLLTFTVPAGATTGPLTIHTSIGDASGGTFTVLPTITLLAPSSGRVGDFIVINGTNFCAPQPGLNLCQTRTQALVQLGSAFKSAAYVSPTFITFYVPNGAATGPIKVILPDGMVTGPTFTVLP